MKNIAARNNQPNPAIRVTLFGSQATWMGNNGENPQASGDNLDNKSEQL